MGLVLGEDVRGVKGESRLPLTILFSVGREAKP